ncbi:hypothetical protein [Mesorhizobium sp. M7A.F.Ca.MR.245.00.0.0]|uniref:hypothetical protein n=1 Tax=Mesorhizobium sp. M7A.F.Ca.MR.245.00.0.0 TaxID=2496778 RepID=UPI000FCCD50D|nr:hypothetical protein [Mesorhizobium sp. M7A.F.Ca.MR.245.00.0.0]RUV21764.1 hypothetical protein EOB80_09750 [Mesorhizobium sp. M7A.F.Ca.MR.245.00.0.0]RUV49462.1 hypothetical protein EOB77_19505 [Mesorhizobium sp. M7A.F.Ca.MR.228.00.0.0]
MTKQHFILLDQGALRSPKLRERIESAQTCIFVVPDVAFSEMSIKKDPIQSMVRSLALLAPVRDRTFASLSCGEIKQLQRTNSVLTIKDILSGQGTKIMHVLMQGESHPDFSMVVQRILETAPDHRKIYDARQDKATMMNCVAIFSRDLGSSGLKALRSGKITNIEKLGIILLIMSGMKALTESFETDTDVRMLLVRLARIMIWAEKQGLGQIASDKIMNDYIDMDFVVAGSYFDETLTCDKMVTLLDQMLRAALEPEHSNEAAKAAVAIGFKVRE